LNDKNYNKKPLSRKITLNGHEISPIGKRKRATQEHLESDLEQKWTAGFKYSWRKMNVAAQDRAG